MAVNNKEDKEQNDKIVGELFDALECDTAISRVAAKLDGTDAQGHTMKKFNAGDLSKKPREVFAAARGEGAIIQHKDRQGKVIEEFVIFEKGEYDIILEDLRGYDL